MSPKRIQRPKQYMRVLRVAVGALVLGLAACAAPPKKPAPEAELQLVWPLPPETPRIRFIRMVSSEADVEQPDPGAALRDMLLGKREERARRLSKPLAVHADKDGRIFVTDTVWGKVLVFDFANRKFAVWGEAGPGVLSKPVGVTSDSQGRVYVTDAMQKRAVVYDRDGNFLFALGRKGELGGPGGIVVNEALGRVYVVDTKKHDIAVFELSTGALVERIGKRGKAPGEFNFPTNIAIDREGTLYVTDTMNFRVQILDPEGAVLKTFGEIGDAMGRFSRPKGIAVDSEGHIYVVDAAFNNFQIFNREGQLLLFVGSLGRAPGQFWLPAGAYIDANDRLYIADQYNFRVQVFQYLGGEEPAAPEAAAPEAVAAQMAAE
jgi:DNA-binding beta-propeller fold protein YncE